MKVARETSAGERIARLIWLGNATVGTSLALLGLLFAIEAAKLGVGVTIAGTSVNPLAAGGLAFGIGSAALVVALARIRKMAGKVVDAPEAQHPFGAQTIR